MKDSLKLLKPLAYLLLRHESLRTFQWYLPLFLSIVASLVFLFLPAKPTFTAADGLIPIVTRLLQILTGFFIASLAAVSTFDKRNMDELMSGTAPYLLIRVNGEKVKDELTRRRFLCYLFGYLSLLSFGLYFLGSLSSLAAENLHVVIPVKYFSACRFTCLFIYLLFTFQLIVSTLLGLYYMTHRIHVKDYTVLMDEEEGES